MPWASSPGLGASSLSTVRRDAQLSSLRAIIAKEAAAGVGALYQFSRDSAANLRRKEDAYNEAIGGFLGGSVLGLASMSYVASYNMVRN